MKKEKKLKSKKSKTPVVVGILVAMGIYSMATSGDKDKNDQIADANTTIIINTTNDILENTTRKTNTTQTNKTYKAVVSQDTSSNSNSKINYENYLNIEMGSSYADVSAIIGEGQETLVNGIRSVVYEWNDPDKSSNINVIVTNGIISGKSQYGLNDIISDVNIEKYNKLNTGMSYDDIKSIIGDGVLSSESLDNNSKDYSWTNKDFSSIYITLKDNKLFEKSQFNLNNDIVSNTTESIFAENTTNITNNIIAKKNTTQIRNTTVEVVNTTEQPINTTNEPVNTTITPIQENTTESIVAESTQAPQQGQIIQETVQQEVEAVATNDRIVYWTPNGKSYHSTPGCSTLSRSKNILNGPLSQCPKSDPCNKCAY